MGWEFGRVRCALWVLMGIASFEGFAAPVLGRYVGIVRHESINRDQLAKLDFISSREDGNTLLLKAVLTLHFGDFKKGDYVAYHFDNVRFNILTREFVFDQVDQPVTLLGRLTAETEFQGELRSAYGGEMATVKLRSDRPAEPELPLMETIWGEYRGKCNSADGTRAETIVQLYTYRSNQGANLVGNPFRSYNIRGFIGEVYEKGCPFSSSKECVWGNIRQGTYNFYENRLAIYSNYKNLSCTVEPQGIQCPGCDLLTRVSDETVGPRELRPPQAKSIWEGSEPSDKAALNGEISSIQGKYRGYVHHEFSNKYQIGSLSILTYQAPGVAGEPPTLRMSAIGTLNFGDEKSAESISYRFKERAYPNPLTQPQFVLSQPEADVDAMLQITSIGRGIVRGVWYSQLFGRVGAFEFRKDNSLTLPATSERVESLSGDYEGTDWDLNILVALGASEPNSNNPFSPLTFAGWVINPTFSPKIHMTGGSYDFYTGRIGFEFGDTVHLGMRTSRRRLQLKKMNYGTAAPLPPHVLQPYRLRSDSRGDSR